MGHTLCIQHSVLSLGGLLTCSRCLPGSEVEAFFTVGTGSICQWDTVGVRARARRGRENIIMIMPNVVLTATHDPPKPNPYHIH